MTAPLDLDEIEERSGKARAGDIYARHAVYRDDVPALCAEVRRLRGEEHRWATALLKVTADNVALRAVADAARNARDLLRMYRRNNLTPAGQVVLDELTACLAALDEEGP